MCVVENDKLARLAVGLLVAGQHVDIMIVLSLYRFVEVEKLGFQKLILFLSLFNLLVNVAD